MRRPPTGIEITVNRNRAWPTLENETALVGGTVTLDGFGFDSDVRFEVVSLSGETIRVRAK